MERESTRAPDASDALQLLGDVPAFAALPDGVLERLAVDAREHAVPAGGTIYLHGNRPQHLHVLLEGQVGLFGIGADGESTVVEVLRAVDEFTLAAVLTDSPYLTSARALTPVRLYLIEAERLRDIVRSEPELAVVMITSLSRHYRMLVQQVKDLKLHSTAQRLGCFLLGLAREQRDPKKLKLPYDKQLLAARLGTTPENLSRAFATLRAHGVRTTGSLVSLDDLGGLTEFSQPDASPER
jgi:CRP/FNR family transcriptional activator FtrB